MRLHRHCKSPDHGADDALVFGPAAPAPGAIVTVEAPSGATIAVHPASGARFSPVEAQVIAIARGDGLASLESPSWIERIAALLFGIEPGRKPLADQRLEALRRAVVVTHHRRHMPDLVAAELAAIGYWPAQIRAVESLAIV